VGGCQRLNCKEGDAGSGGGQLHTRIRRMEGGTYWEETVNIHQGSSCPVGCMVHPHEN
jgi:hypothetical protein